METMENYNFVLTNIDTDAISFCKPEMTPFTKEERQLLIQSLNSQFDDEIKFTDDGYYPQFIVLKSKNYIMIDEAGKRKMKGSSLKSSTLEPKLKEMLGKMIDALLEDRQTDMVKIYHEYICKVRDGIVDIKPWSKKLSLSPTTFESKRLNETKIIDAIQGSEYKSGDRIYVYSKPDGTLKLAERFDGDYDRDVYYEKIFRTTKRFETILPVKEMFLNYALKRNNKLVEQI